MNGGLEHFGRAAIVGLLAAVGTAQAGVGFWDLGSGYSPEDGTFDGSTIVGSNQITGEYFMWTPGGGATDIGGVIAGNGVGGQARISDDGSRVSGTDLNRVTNFHEMSIYDTTTGTWTALGGIGGSSDSEVSSGWGMSRNGQHVVGLGWTTGSSGNGRAIQWTDGGSGVTDLGSTTTRSSRANAVDESGNVVVGWQDSDSGSRQAAVWNNGVQTIIQGPGGSFLTEATAVSGDGEWVVGIGATGSANEAWRWSAATGMQQLGSILGGGFPPPRGFAVDVSHDGSTVLGFDRGFGPPTGGEGWLWTESGGIVSLDAFFASHGVPNVDNFHYSLPLGMSTDGKTFWGLGRSDSVFSTGWVVTIPSPGAGVLMLAAGAGVLRRRR